MLMLTVIDGTQELTATKTSGVVGVKLVWEQPCADYRWLMHTPCCGP